MGEFLELFEYYGYFFVLIAIIFTMIASARVNSTFKRYSAQRNHMGLTGAEAARKVLQQNGVYDVSIQRVAGNLTDHFDPRNRTIYLSQNVYDAPTTAAIGVAAHEAGHAVQHAEGYVPVKIRSAIIPITNIGSRLSMPLILLGLMFSIFELSLLGVLCFGLSLVFQLVTLPTEFDASRRALTALQSFGFLTEEELQGSRKTLRAAAMTYVAALAVSLTQFLRLFAIVTSGRRRR